MKTEAKITNFRLTKHEIARLKLLAGAADSTTTALVRQLIPSETLCQILVKDAELEQRHPCGVLADVIAAGLLARIRGDANSIDPYFTESLEAIGVLDLYARWQDATTDRKEWRLEPAPRGGAWEARGITGGIMLSYDEKLTVDGIERVVGGR